MDQYTTQQIPLQDSNEEWRDIPDFEGRYQVSNQGRVRTNRRWKHPQSPVWKLKASVIHRDTGYEMVTFTVNRKATAHYVHRLVALAFIGFEPGMEVNHINGDKTDNRLANLEYCTRTENQRHSWDKLSRKPSAHPGEANPSSILTREQVTDIRRLAKSGVPRKTLASRFGVSYYTICDIVTRKSWRHIP